MGTARNLAEGNGYTPSPGAPPISNFPPLFVLVLAGFGALGADPLTTVRYLNPVVFGLLVWVVGVLVARLTGRVALAVAAQLLLMAGIDFLVYATSGLSEPLFLLLAALAVAALAPCLDRAGGGNGRPGLLVAAGVLAGAACLTRYVGVALVGGAVVALVVVGRRWRAAAVFAAVALAPLAGWFAWLSADGGDATNRPVVWHAPGWSYLTTGLRSASNWFVPNEVPMPWRAVAAGVVVAVVVALGVVTWRRPRDNRRPAALVAVLAAAYLAVLVVDRLFFEVTGRLDARFLLPVHLAAIALALWVVSGVDIGRTHVARIGLSVVVGLQVASGLAWVVDAVSDEEVRPGGFAAPSWAGSEVVDQVRALDESEPVYTNQVDVLWLHTGRVAKALPEKAVFLTGKANPDYPAQVQEMHDDLARGGLLVYFTRSPARRVFLPPPTELEAVLPLQRVAADSVGVAWRLSSPRAPGA